MKETSIVTWKYNYTKTKPFELTFINCVTGMIDKREYKTQAAARAAETRFHNRMARIYTNVSISLDNAYYPYM